jgi:hypothetical protein
VLFIFCFVSLSFFFFDYGVWVLHDDTAFSVLVFCLCFSVLFLN